MAPPLPRLETLYERAGGSPVGLPDALRESYGGELRFAADGPRVFANFVSTIDGLVSFGMPGLESAGVIAKGHAGDRLVMGILRAVADVVVSGAGTLRAEPKVTWTPQQIFPRAADLFRDLRRARGLPAKTRVAIFSASGDVDPHLPVFTSPDVEATVVTSAAGAARLTAAGANGVTIRVVGDKEPAMRQAFDAVMADTGAKLILSEAGPSLFGRMLEERVVDELFLTVSPHIAGRSEERRGISLVEPQAFHPERAPWADLVGVKRSEDFLLLRYAFTR